MSSCCIRPAPRITQNVSEPVVPIRGFEVLQTNLNLAPTASGVWTDTALQVQLPVSGTYHLDANIRAALAATSPVNTYIVTRLFDVTNGVVLANSEMLIIQISISASSPVSIGGNQCGTASVEYSVAAPTLVRVQAARFSTSSTALIVSDANGRSTFRYEWVSP